MVDEDEANVEPLEQIDQVLETVEQDQESVDNEITEETQSQKHVPLSALQKERKKRQELEEELKWERRAKELQMKQSAPPPVDDSAKYESATREDLFKSQQEAIRAIEEKLWIKNNPEKYERVNDYLPEFLKQRPNLGSAIGAASNRYEEAYTLMEALTPRQQTQLKQTAPKKAAPNAPTGVPKSAALNESVDVMTMSDADFNKWRQAQKRRR
jgi:chromosome segregation ATPase